MSRQCPQSDRQLERRGHGAPSAEVDLEVVVGY